MTKRFELCIPLMVREHDPARSDDDHTGMSQRGVWIGIHAKDEDDAVDQLARLIANEGDGEERH